MRTKLVPPNPEPPPGERKTVGALRLKDSKPPSISFPSSPPSPEPGPSNSAPPSSEESSVDLGLSPPRGASPGPSNSALPAEESEDDLGLSPPRGASPDADDFGDELPIRNSIGAVQRAARHRNVARLSPPHSHVDDPGAARGQVSEFAGSSTAPAKGPRSVRVPPTGPPRVPFFHNADRCVPVSVQQEPIVEPADLCDARRVPPAADMSEQSLWHVRLILEPEDLEAEGVDVASQPPHYNYNVSASAAAGGGDSDGLKLQMYGGAAQQNATEGFVEDKPPTKTKRRRTTGSRLLSKGQPGTSSIWTRAPSSAVGAEPSNDPHDDPATSWYPPTYAPDILECSRPAGRILEVGKKLEDADGVPVRRADDEPSPMRGNSSDEEEEQVSSHSSSSSISGGDSEDDEGSSDEDEDGGENSSDEDPSREGAQEPRQRELELVLRPVPRQFAEADNPRAQVRALLAEFHEIVQVLLSDKAKQRDRPDFKAAKILLKRGLYVRSGGVCGEVPGVLVGDSFHYRAEMLMLGLHRFAQGGVDYISAANSGIEDRSGKPISVAGCIVTTPSASENTDSDDGSTLVYAGRLQKEICRTNLHLKRGNLGLMNSFEKNLDVRIVRSFKLKYSTTQPRQQTEPHRIYFYDGLYKVQSWCLSSTRDVSDRILFTLVRNPGQLPLPSLRDRKEALNMS